MSLTVAFDHQIFSSQRYGGISRYFVELATRLSSHLDSQVDIVAPLYINNYLREYPARKLARGLYIGQDFPKMARIVNFANRLAEPIAWSRAKADILHETYFSLRPIGRARKRVLTVHDLIHELLLDVEEVKAAKRAAIERADHIICVSATTQRDLIAYYNIDESRTSVVHLGCSLTSEFNGETKMGSAARPSILYVGNRSGYKNFDTLLRAFASSSQLRDFELVAFGTKPITPAETKEIERLKISDRVRFESGSDRDLAEWYRTASAFVYPSKYEGFGIPPLEAMNYGCPVVCSNAGSIPEVVGPAGSYFDPDDAEELRSVLEKVATDSTLQADLRMRGFSRISVFSWDRCAEETAAIYRSI